MVRSQMLAVLAVTLLAHAGWAAPGDDCPAPLMVTLPAELPFLDEHQYTCGRGNFYDETNTCLYGFANGEEIIYELQVTSPVEVEIVMDPNGGGWTAVALGSNCPPAGDGCLAYCAGDDSQPRVLPCRYLAPGTYTVMVDRWPLPGAECIADFNLSIVACELVRGACCVDLACIGTLDEATCLGAGGAWYEGFDCESFACPLEIHLLPECCQTAQAITTLPFAATFATWVATADGPAGSCNAANATTMQNDVWFAYTAAYDCTLNLTVWYDLYDGLAAVYAGPHCAALTELCCLNSGGVGNPDTDFVALEITAGMTYWFQIGDYGMSPGGGPTLLALSGAATAAPGDMNCNGVVGLDDINPFVLLLSNPSAWQGEFPGCPMSTGDINGDGAVDFSDINPFVALLSGGGP